MIEDLKRRVKKTKQFVEDHPTLTACAVTGVVSAVLASKYTYNVTTEHCVQRTQSFLNGVGEELSEEFAEKDLLIEGLQDEIVAYRYFLKKHGLLDEFNATWGMLVDRYAPLTKRLAQVNFPD